MLFDLSKDIGEKTNLAKDNLEVVERLHLRMTELDKEIGKNACSPWVK